ncbi:uncharacterized protein GIQ15_05973 [Arthroderma uncinatum]|uniref:uncharacterized protein n=1 Tax=Arthroderma uncinatum TaxID=74035 RepID=UPI00144A9E5D|nr:uncharacterized protein GIQ15_05973 [Arthroderma uncinatum]KAF3480626.1 hypothetical protein GIQ15_05973 [Arthroderma uncinatum]
MISQNQQRAELLQAEVDEATESYFRLRIDGTIRYLTINPGLYSEDTMCFGPSLLPSLPDFPTGDWNDALVTRNPGTGKPHFESVGRTKFPSVVNTWHGTLVDYLDITVKERIHTGIYAIESPIFDIDAIIKFVRFEWETGYLENETTAYQWIDGHGIGPRFLGHLTEDGRVIGFVVERITGGRHAGPQDLELCQQALSRLHALGIRHGDTNRFNFLIRESRAVIIDFDTARKCDDQEALRKEMDDLPGFLESTSRAGGGGFI